MPHNILMQNLPKVPSQLRNQQRHSQWANLLRRSLAEADNKRCEYGGIGRPSGLKIRREMRPGSTPGTRTIFIL